MMKKQKNQVQQLYIVFVWLGILLGSIACGVLLQKDHGFFIDFMMNQEQIDFDEMNQRALLFFILRKRCICLFIFMLLAFLISFPNAFYLSLFFWGGYYGLFISMILYYKNVEAIPEALLCFFPHWLFYYFGILSIVKIFQRGNTYCSLNRTYGEKSKIKYFLKIFVIFICFATGIFFEFYSQNFLKEIFTNM